MFLDDKAPNDTPPRRAIQAAGIPNQNVVVIHWGTDVATGTEDAQRLSVAAPRPLRAPACGNSSHIAARLDEGSGSLKVSWNLVAMDASGVVGAARRTDADAGFHLSSITFLACFVGLGSR